MTRGASRPAAADVTFRGNVPDDVVQPSEHDPVTMWSLGHLVWRQVSEVAASLLHHFCGTISELCPEGHLDTLDGTSTRAHEGPRSSLIS
jgi:hypothetical protein